MVPSERSAEGPAPGASPAPRAHLPDLQHLAAADVAVAVEVIHAEGPLELLLQLAQRGHAQCDDRLPEARGAVAIGVKGAGKTCSRPSFDRRRRGKRSWHRSS